MKATICCPIPSNCFLIFCRIISRQIAQLMKMIKTVDEQKAVQRRQDMKKRVSEHQKKMAETGVRREKRQKELKKEMFKVMGQMQRKSKRH